jgi:hypothetical protein
VVGAVIGSANLSQAALTDRAGVPQGEAAVLVLEPKLIAEISKWFESLWNDKPQTAEIKDSDLERPRKERKKFPARWPHTVNAVPPPPDVLPEWMIRMAKAVAKIPLEEKFKNYRDQLQSLVSKQSLSAKDVAKLADTLAGWTKHRAVYRNFEKHSRKKTLDGLRMLFDESRDIYDRLTEIKEKKLLKGLQIPASGSRAETACSRQLIFLSAVRLRAYPHFPRRLPQHKMLRSENCNTCGYL